MYLLTPIILIILYRQTHIILIYLQTPIILIYIIS
jgi:hypothetical protein